MTLSRASGTLETGLDETTWIKAFFGRYLSQALPVAI
jgi:hypothetical protein